jgi:hypothetical protein
VVSLSAEAFLESISLIVGIALVLLAVVDGLWTTLWLDGGAGPVSSRITTWGWNAVLALNGPRRHRALSVFGPLTLFTVVLLWVILLWTGWTLVFASNEGALIHEQRQTPANWAGRVAFVGSAMFGIGTGDYSVSLGGWQVTAAVASATGVLFITLAVTYLLSVIPAVVAKRAFASQVFGLGHTPAEVLANGWNGHDFSSLDLALQSLSSDLAALTEQYLSYPILQYYHAARMTKSPSVALAVLDETLTLLRFAVAEEQRPNRTILHGARKAVQSFLETLDSAFIPAADEEPPPPDLAPIRRAGIPLLAEAALDDALGGLSERRRKLLGLVRKNGWEWPHDSDR